MPSLNPTTTSPASLPPPKTNLPAQRSNAARADKKPHTATTALNRSGEKRENPSLQRPSTVMPPTSSPAYADIAQVSVHPPLPAFLNEPACKYITHDLSIISSSKIHAKVSQVLKLLFSESFTSATTPPAKPDGLDVAMTNHEERPGDALSRPDAGEAGEDTSEGREAAERVPVVRLSAKSCVASKLITVVEIVKREALARAACSAEERDAGSMDVDFQQKGPGEKAKGRGKAERLYQYNALRGVHFPATDPKHSREQGAGMGKKRKRNIANDESAGKEKKGKKSEDETSVNKNAEEIVNPIIDVHASEPRDSANGKGEGERRRSAGLPNEADDGGDREIADEDSDDDDDDDDDYFGHITPKAETLVRQQADRARLRMIEELEDSPATKAASRPTPVLTVYLCRQSLREPREEMGEEVI